MYKIRIMEIFIYLFFSFIYSISNMLFDTYYLLAVDPNDGSTMIHLLRDDWSEECTVGAILLALQASIALHAIFMMQSTC